VCPKSLIKNIWANPNIFNQTLKKSFNFVIYIHMIDTEQILNDKDFFKSFKNATDLESLFQKVA